MKKEALLEWLDNWRDFCGESCVRADCVMGIEECEPAYKQIVALLKKEVTEEWIEEKARVISNWSHTWGFIDRKDFIRSLVEEVRGKQEKK